jgi:hypothetical protein
MTTALPPRPHPSARRAPALLATSLALAACGADPVAPPATAPVASVVIAADSLTLRVGDRAQLSTRVLDARGGVVPGRAVTWRVLDGSVAAVDAGGAVSGLRASATRVVAEVDGRADSALVRVVPVSDRYLETELAYFGEIAFGFEFGAASRVIRRWPGDVRVAVRGTPTAEDRATLAAVLGELTATIGGPVRLRDAGVGPAELEVHFVPRAQFTGVVAAAVPNNVGQFWLWFDAAEHFSRGVVLIGTDIPARLRQHLIREEVTQSLGLAQDSPRDPFSVFYSGYSESTVYTALDLALVEMLYRDEVRPGMSAAEAIPVLRQLLRRVAAPSVVAAVRAPAAPGGAGAAMRVGGGS